MKRKITKIITNTSLGALLLVLIAGPVGAVARISGLNPQLNLGSFLGARVNSSEDTLFQIKSGEIKEIRVKTFWGQKATYQRSLEISNKTHDTKTYQLEIIAVEGEGDAEQEVNAYFQKNNKQTLLMEPGETAWATLEITAPKRASLKTSLTTLKIAIWTL